MSKGLILAVAVAYLFTAADLWIKHNYPFSIAFFAYAVANVAMVFVL